MMKLRIVTLILPLLGACAVATGEPDEAGPAFASTSAAIALAPTAKTYRIGEHAIAVVPAIRGSQDASAGGKARPTPDPWIPWMVATALGSSSIPVAPVPAPPPRTRD